MRAWVIAIRCRAQLSWRLPPRSSRWRRCLPELASSGATPAWRASWASVWKRSIGPISPSSLAALKAPQPGSASSAGAVALDPRLQLAVEGEDRAGEAAAAADELARDPHQHRLLAAARAGGRAGRARRCGRARPAGPPAAGRARAGASAAAAAPAAVRRRDHRGDRRAASAPAAAPRLAAGDRAAARAAPPWRPRARRSGPTCRASGRRAAAAPSASAAPAPAAHPQRCSSRSSARVSCRQSSTAHSRSPAQRRRPGEQVADRQPPSAQRRPADLVDRDRRQRLLVYVHSNHDHSDRLLQPLGATGERTDLNRGSSHAPIRSRSAVSGRRRRHNAGKSTYGATCGNRVSRRRPESASLTGRHHQAENDIEFGNVTGQGAPHRSPHRLPQRRASSNRGSSRTAAKSSSLRASSRNRGNSSTDRRRCANVSSPMVPARVAKHA